MVDLTYYNELLQQATTKTYERTGTIAKEFVPKMYAELRNQGYEPYLARHKIETDCGSMWLVETIRGELPDEAKDTVKQENGRKSVEAKKKKRLTEKKYETLLTHDVIMEINNASIASVDHNVRIYINAKHDFINAEPVTPKLVTAEPIAVKNVNSAPVKST